MVDNTPSSSRSVVVVVVATSTAVVIAIAATAAYRYLVVDVGRYRGRGRIDDVDVDIDGDVDVDESKRRPTTTTTTSSSSSSSSSMSISECEMRIAKLEEARRSERVGRIRAEMRLRTLLKRGGTGGGDGASRRGGSANADDDDGDEDDVDDDVDDDRDDEDNVHDDDDGVIDATLRPLSLRRIGRAITPYTKRMGTPRQGGLVPSGRGYIELDVPHECVLGLEDYSHCWIIFGFHANTDARSPAASSHASSSSSSSSSRIDDGRGSSRRRRRRWSDLTKTKVRPPRGNGIRVGALATRSPHRPNNIGLSLVSITHLDAANNRLQVSALDLVNGTPVYDIKPCVPWDVPGHHDNRRRRRRDADDRTTTTTTTTTTMTEECKTMRVPDWVDVDDEIRNVKFDDGARASLLECLNRGSLAPLYTSSNDVGAHCASMTITEVLAQDPRSSNTNRGNGRGRGGGGRVSTTTTTSDNYRMLFCNVEVEFIVDDVHGVTVTSVRDDIDMDGVELVDGIPVLLR
ncbi:hypothetical protein ACHAXA_006350 [Cyclostephanos tholiformis]|uniref:TsaA-like domain-containing protein n=1 Tax=Cyclostephanos tholiformis TaxID=382380 RepID=A0ABD3RRF2_9STRA